MAPNVTRWGTLTVREAHYRQDIVEGNYGRAYMQ